MRVWSWYLRFMNATTTRMKYELRITVFWRPTCRQVPFFGDHRHHMCRLLARKVVAALTGPALVRVYLYLAKCEEIYLFWASANKLIQGIPNTSAGDHVSDARGAPNTEFRSLYVGP